MVEWLQNWNQKYGHPTWRKVVIAVASKVGGDNPAEAYRIGQQYKGECSLPHIGEGGGGEPS